MSTQPPPPLEPEPLLTTAEVAALFGVSPSAVCQWAKSGRVPAVRTPAGTYRLREADIHRLLRGESQ